MLLYAINISLSLSIAFGALAWRTNNFSSFTYETDRRVSVESTPVDLSNWQLQNSHGEIINLSDLTDKTLLLDFVYTRCPTICRVLGSRYQQLQRAIDASENKDIALLSISIDPGYDTPERLDLYRKRYKGQQETWYLAKPINEDALKLIMAETGLRVIPDGFGELAHSDAIHLIENQKLTKINAWESDDWETVINNAKGFQLE